MTNPISPKVTAAAFASALTTLIVVLATVIWPDALTETQATLITGALAVVLQGLVGFLVRDPLRQAGLNARAVRSSLDAALDTTPETSPVDPTNGTDRP